MTTRHAVIDTATGYVKRYGTVDFTLESVFKPLTETQVDINTVTQIPDGVLQEYTKVVGGNFVEMTAPEKAAVDAVLPTNVVQRKIVDAETIVATGSTDATTGWASVVGGTVTARPLKAGDYQLAVAFELSLTAVAVWAAGGPDRAAQARLLLNGAEIATWVEPLNFYSRMGVTLGDVFTEGAVLTLDLQIRRFGPAGSARARKIRLELSPVGAARAL